MSDVAARLRERAAEAKLPVSDELVARLVAYFELLQRWNRKMNLTSLSDSGEGIDRLLVEPLAAASALPHGSALADLGSGGGSPAIPLALALESPELLMVESRSRKAAFLREAAIEVQLNAMVEAARFEEISKEAGYARRFDVVSLRAVRPDADALTAAKSLLKAGGLVALFAGAPTGISALGLPHDLAWRGTVPLLRSSNSHLTLLFHVEHP